MLAREATVVEANPQLHDLARDGKCHDAVMWFTHHVPEERKAELFESGALEAMPSLEGATNILLDDHLRAYLSDFGLAKSAESEMSLSASKARGNMCCKHTRVCVEQDD